MKKYKHIFFDFDDTLWDFEANALKALQDIFLLYKLEDYFDSFESFFKLYSFRNDQLWEKYRAGQITKAELNKERFAYPLRQAGLLNEGIATKMGNDFLTICPTKKELVEDCFHVLDYLYPHYSLYVISNGFSEVQYAKLSSAGLENYFKKVFLSDRIGKHKPHRMVFEYAIKSSNARKCESLMIGDNWKADIEGARAFGIDQVYFGPLFEWNAPPTYHIQSLKELKEFL